MAYRDFYVGQRVRIREWYDMEKEFGLKRGGSIACKFSFSIFMKPICGCEATICGIYGCEVKLRDWTGCDENTDTTFFYSLDMIEPADAPTTYEFDGVAFNAMFGITT